MHGCSGKEPTDLAWLLGLAGCSDSVLLLLLLLRRRHAIGARTRQTAEASAAAAAAPCSEHYYLREVGMHAESCSPLLAACGDGT